MTSYLPVGKILARTLVTHIWSNVRHVLGGKKGGLFQFSCLVQCAFMLRGEVIRKCAEPLWCCSVQNQFAWGLLLVDVLSFGLMWTWSCSFAASMSADCLPFQVLCTEKWCIMLFNQWLKSQISTWFVTMSFITFPLGLLTRSLAELHTLQCSTQNCLSRNLFSQIVWSTFYSRSCRQNVDHLRLDANVDYIVSVN